MLLSAGPVVDTGCQQEVKRPSARRNIYMRLSLIIAQLNSEDQVAKFCGPYRDIAARLFQQQPKKYKMFFLKTKQNSIKNDTHEHAQGIDSLLWFHL